MFAHTHTGSEKSHQIKHWFRLSSNCLRCEQISGSALSIDYWFTWHRRSRTRDSKTRWNRTQINSLIPQVEGGRGGTSYLFAHKQKLFPARLTRYNFPAAWMWQIEMHSTVMPAFEHFLIIYWFALSCFLSICCWVSLDGNWHCNSASIRKCMKRPQMSQNVPINLCLMGRLYKNGIASEVTQN